MAIRGWVYVLTNKAMPGIVKVGFSTKDPSLRANELEGTGLPYPFKVIYDVLVADPRDVEQAVHKLLAAHHESKEFFRVEVRDAVRVIRSVIKAQGKSVLLEAPSSQAIDEPAEVSPQHNQAPIRCSKCGTVAIIKGKLPALIRCIGCGSDFRPRVTPE